MFQTKPTLLLLMLKRQCKECFLKIFKLNLSFSLLRRSEGVSSFHSAQTFTTSKHETKHGARAPSMCAAGWRCWPGSWSPASCSPPPPRGPAPRLARWLAASPRCRAASSRCSRWSWSRPRRTPSPSWSPAQAQAPASTGNEAAVWPDNRTAGHQHHLSF